MQQSVPSFAGLLESAEHSAVHLEMRDAYGVADEADDFSNWRATGRRDSDPDSDYWKPWVDSISRKVRQGVDFRRARIVSVPVSDYIRYEHAATSVNVVAGEQVRWLPRAEASGLALPGNDFWVFDGRAALFNIFDGHGDWAVPKQQFSTDREVVELCTRAFESVWERATPHEKFAV
ncbi:DUF6879 family protein [Kitasatospora sp. NPDC058218]|uniref:DUF6879 family protein n=1 Tax=Kitasatospora sp. NPDC058218 TaxID=3346385 RepID=UPI0036DB8A70